MGLTHDGSLDASSVVSSSKSTMQSRSKVAMVLISGVGFLADAYDLFVIDFVVAILSATSFAAPSLADKGVIVSSTLAGAVVGQLFFGIAADFLGRRIMFVSTALLVVLGSVSSALVGWGYTDRVLSFSIYHQLAICRFILGCGIGGEYPLSATVSAETETREELFYGTEVKYPGGILWYLSHKPNSIAAVFSMQGFGMLLSPLIVLLCISLGMSMETTWRLCLGIGAVPSAIAFIFRWKMSETNAFQKMKDELSASRSSATATSLTNNSPLQIGIAANFNVPKDKHSDDAALPKNQVNSDTDSQTAQASGYQDLGILMNQHTQPESEDANLYMDINKFNGNEHSANSKGFKGFSPYLSEMSPDKLHGNDTLGHGKKKLFDVNSNNCGARNGAYSLRSSPLEAKKVTLRGFMHHFKKSLNIIRSLKYVIIGTSVTWFLIDVTLYGTGSFKSIIVAKIFIDNNAPPANQGSNPSTRRLIEIRDKTTYNFQIPDSEASTLFELPEDSEQAKLDEFVDELQTNEAKNVNAAKTFNDFSSSDAKDEKPDDTKNTSKFLRSSKMNSSNNKTGLANSAKSHETELKRPVNFNSINSPNQFQRTLLQSILATPVKPLSYQLRHLAVDNTGANSAAGVASNPTPIQRVDPDRARETVMLQARMGAIVALLAIPGYVLSLLFIHKIGTQQLQFWGFLATALVFIALGVEQLVIQRNIPILELILFGLTFLCSNFGPNTTTFIIPTQVYPTIIRATCHGFSAAMGKLGGVVGTSLFSVIEASYGLGWLLVMCGIVAVIGALFTFLIPKDLKSKKHTIHKLLDLK